jgi:hypothetical protein
VRKVLIGIFLFFAACPANASVVLSSVVTSSSGLFTYSYLIDNTAGSVPVDELAIVVARPPDQPDLTPVPPISFASPVGWSFKIGTGGTDPVSGGVWAWQALQSAQAVQPGSSLSGFSFTTDAAPTLSPLENYFFLSDSFDRIQVGNISAPEVAIAHPVPEPSTWAMMVLGFAGIGFIAYRRKSKATLIDAGPAIVSLN